MIARHLKKSGMSYTCHMKRSLRLSLESFKIFLVFFIHSFFPFLFEETGSRMVINLKKTIDEK